MWLGGTKEVADLLEVSRSRVYQMAKSGVLPAPLDTPSCGPIWDMGEVARFLQGWERKPGNPHKPADQQLVGGEQLMIDTGEGDSGVDVAGCPGVGDPDVDRAGG